MNQAFLYEKLTKDRVQCRLCGQECLIGPGKKGLCGVRENRAGTLVSLVYGRPIARNVDPIEKKPLFHFLPGSLSYSIATVGCNLTCKHCQNSDISQMPRDRSMIMGDRVPPREIVRAARESGCESISYTYTEPTVYAEYAYDTGMLARESGLKNVFVSNGFMSPQAVAKLGPMLDGANIDLKAFSDDFYRQVCGARLEPVLETILGLKKQGVWVEITTLLIPGLNDSPGELIDLADWIATRAGPETPWHISRFHPTYKLPDKPPTPPESLARAAEIGRSKGLRYVYLGNLPGRGGEDTICHSCGRVVISRLGFSIQEMGLNMGKCPGCGNEIAGVFN